MKIDYISDIHIDRWNDDLSWLKTKKSDKIIIAGDVADSIDDVEYGLRKIKAYYDEIYYVDGNHEYENCRFAYQEQKNNLRDLCNCLT
jgi:predicted phosphodiesterase